MELTDAAGEHVISAMQMKILVNKPLKVDTIKLSTKPKRDNTMFVGTIGQTKHDTKMNSKVVKKQLIQLRTKFEADIKAKLKAEKLIVFDDVSWNHPCNEVFKKNESLKDYLEKRKLSLSSTYAIWSIACDPASFGFATAAELAEFKNVTWPKLKAEYNAEIDEIRKKRAKTAKDIRKLKAKIAKMQSQLKELEG